MTDLTRLSVSLTKHNAHKVALLLKEYPLEEVFERLKEVRAEKAQTRKNLSAYTGEEVPAVWRDAQRIGPDAIDALLLLAIIFSHHKLIRAMAEASSRQGYVGTVERGVQLDGKAYTNFARVVDQLGFAAQLSREGITFDLSGLFEIPRLGSLAAELLELKLQKAGWDGLNSVAEESVALGFHDIFGVSGAELAEWLISDKKPEALDYGFLTKDKRFFERLADNLPFEDFSFRPGHVERAVESLARSGSAKSTANRLHNEIQNRLYAFLTRKLGAKNVGTEMATGVGTAVDVAARQQETTAFYEIKTSPSVRTSIRQALPQLLEYAHWPEDKRADRLVVVSHLPITDAADKYLKFLRNNYKIPISYEQFDLETDQLVEGH